MAVYYPSARLRLLVRLEDFGVDPLSAEPPAPRALEAGQANVAASLRRRTPADAGNAVIRQADAWCVVAANSIEAARAGGATEINFADDEGSVVVARRPVGAGSSVPQASSEDDLTTLVDIRPLRLALELNGIRAADTFTATLDARDVPFDPRAIRSLAVEAYLGTVPAESYARAMLAPSSSTDARLSLVPDSDPVRRVSNLRFMGFADSISLGVEAEDPAAVELEGRDNTSILLDAEMPPDLVIDDSVPLDHAVATIIATLPAARGFCVQARSEMPVLASVRPPNLMARDGKQSRRPAQAEKVSYWDYVLDTVQAAGFVAYVDVIFDSTGAPHPAVIMQDPRSLLGIGAARSNDPFRGRRLVTPSGTDDIVQVRRMIHGRNVLSATIERKFARQRANGVEVRSYDPAAKRTLIVRYPPDDNVPQNASRSRGRATHVQPGDGGADSRYNVFVVRGINDPATLERYARSVFDQIARQEVAFKIRTEDLASFGGDNEDPDLLDMKSGDPIEFLFARRDLVPRAPTASSMAVLSEHDDDDRAAYLVSLGYPPEVARALAGRVRAADIYPIMRTRNIRFDYTGHGDSPKLSIELDAVNFLTLREDPQEVATTDVVAFTDEEAGIVVGRVPAPEPALPGEDAR